MNKEISEINIIDDFVEIIFTDGRVVLLNIYDLIKKLPEYYFRENKQDKNCVEKCDF